jgi:hypothetical protein
MVVFLAKRSDSLVSWSHTPPPMTLKERGAALDAESKDVVSVTALGLSALLP